MTDLQAFNADRVLKLVRSNKILKKTYEKSHPKGDRNEGSLRSLYNALIKGDRNMMALYEETR